MQHLTQVPRCNHMITPHGMTLGLAIFRRQANDLMHLQRRQQQIHVFYPNVKVLCHGA